MAKRCRPSSGRASGQLRLEKESYCVKSLRLLKYQVAIGKLFKSKLKQLSDEKRNYGNRTQFVVYFLRFV